MAHSPRIYLTNEDGSAYTMIDMNDKTLTFDVDLSRVPCDYNLALYFSEMNQHSRPGDGYCDAQGQGYACAEMDIFEGNVDVTHMTSHPCTGSDCDKSGVVQKTVFSDVGIDTSRPFTVVTTFVSGHDDALASIEQYFKQQHHTDTTETTTTETTITETYQYGGLRSMGESFRRGMVLVISIWTNGPGGMSWLNGGCGAYETDYAAISGSYGNISIATGSSFEPTFV